MDRCPRGPGLRPRCVISQADGANRATRGRRIHALHRRYHRHAKGRDVRRWRLDCRTRRVGISTAWNGITKLGRRDGADGQTTHRRRRSVHIGPLRSSDARHRLLAGLVHPDARGCAHRQPHRTQPQSSRGARSSRAPSGERTDHRRRQLRQATRQCPRRRQARRFKVRHVLN